MIFAAGVELAITVLGTLIFLAFYRAPWRHDNPPVAWHLWAFTVATGCEAAMWLAALAGLPVPPWVALVVFGLVDVVVVWRLWLLLRNPVRKVVPVSSTQSKHPWRATARTVLAAVVGVLPLLPEIAAGLHIGTMATVAQFLTITAGITRLLARPDVEALLHRFAPWLAAAPPPPVVPPSGGAVEGNV